MRIKILLYFKIFYNWCINKVLGEYMIRQANESDIPGVVKIARQNREFIGFVMNVALKESIEKGSLFVYERDNDIIGFVHFHKRLDGWTTLHEIAVAKEYHGKGIGKQLLDIPKEPVRLKTTIDNVNAIAMYEKQGFKFVGTHQGKKRELAIFEKGAPELKIDINNKRKMKFK